MLWSSCRCSAKRLQHHLLAKRQSKKTRKNKQKSFREVGRVQHPLGSLILYSRYYLVLGIKNKKNTWPNKEDPDGGNKHCTSASYFNFKSLTWRGKSSWRPLPHITFITLTTRHINNLFRSCPHFLQWILWTTNKELISLIAHSSLWSVSFLQLTRRSMFYLGNEIFSDLLLLPFHWRQRPYSWVNSRAV